MKYRRVPHRVQATLLAAPWEWTTPQGDRLLAKAGDYRLTDESSGTQWSITEKALRAGYNDVGHGRFVSDGEVRAYRVSMDSDVVTVVSTEGAELARPGDWIITDHDGNQWVVDHSWFLDRYEQLHGS